MPDEQLLAFDFGLKRIGVAVGTWLNAGAMTTARALTVIEAEANEPRFAAIAKLISEWQPTRLIVGDPRHPDGTPHAMTARCERFANQLRGRFKLPVEQIDERLSSVEAESALKSPSYQRRPVREPIKARIDAEAARVILERWQAHHTNTNRAASQGAPTSGMS